MPLADIKAKIDENPVGLLGLEGDIGEGSYRMYGLFDRKLFAM
tara:strand:+ start:393 stop:521 length:129 start_codon:yes stop_codon:yes gene_type:complete